MISPRRTIFSGSETFPVVVASSDVIAGTIDSGAFSAATAMNISRARRDATSLILSAAT
jgi:hypothetical protein